MKPTPDSEMVQLCDRRKGITARGSSTTIFQDPSLNPMSCHTDPQKPAHVPAGSIVWNSIPSLQLIQVDLAPLPAAGPDLASPSPFSPRPQPAIVILTKGSKHVLLVLLDPEDQVRVSSSGQETGRQPLASPGGQALEEVSAGKAW